MTDLELPANSSEQRRVMLVYVLLLAAVAVPVTGVLGVVGVIIASVYREDAPQWLQTHYRLQIRTFWASLVYILAGMLLLIMLVGYAILLFWLVWYLVRCIKGIRYLNRGQSYPFPEAWLF